MPPTTPPTIAPVFEDEEEVLLLLGEAVIVDPGGRTEDVCITVVNICPSADV